MFPTYSPLIPMIPPCTYSPQPSVQIYLGYRHCTPIVLSPISASLFNFYEIAYIVAQSLGLLQGRSSS